MSFRVNLSSLGHSMNFSLSSRIYILIALFSLLVNWPIFFSNLLVNDDLTIITAQLSGDYVGFKASFIDQGKPLGYFLHRSIAFLLPTGRTSYHIANFICITVSAMLLFAIISRAWPLRKSSALVVTLGLLCFPAYGIQTFAIATSKLVTNVALFGGIYLVYRYWVKELKWLGLVMGILLMAISSIHAASIPFLYAFLFSFAFVELQKRIVNSDQPKHDLVRGFWISVLLTITVVATFFFEKLFFEQSDYFRGTYNQIKIDPVAIYKGILFGIDQTLVAQSVRLTGLSWFRLLMLSIFSLSVVVSSIYFRQQTNKQSQDKNRTFFLLLMAFVFLILAIFPYAVVGKLPMTEGYQSRWASYVGVSAGLLLGLLYEMGFRIKFKVFQIGWTAAIVFLMLSFTSLIWDNYGKWQRLSIENETIIAKLKTLPYPKNIDFFCVDNNLLSEQFYFRRWYDWAYIFSRSWPTNKEMMGVNSSYCKDRGMYKNEMLPTELPLVSIIPISVEDMFDATHWMYYGKSRPSYRLGALVVHVGDKRLEQIQGAEVVIESVKDIWNSSDIIAGYNRGLDVSYDIP